MRTSSYTIYVDLPGNQQEMLLVHGYTGAYDRVSRPVASFLRSKEAKRAPKPLYGEWASEPAPGNSGEAAYVPSPKTLEILEERGFLTRKSVEEEVAFLRDVATRLHEQRTLGMPGYIFMPNYDCNLRCPYCFQDHMRSKPEFQHLLKRMSTTTVDRILAGIGELEEKHGIPRDTQVPREVGFFGGEPLLAANRPVVEYIMSRFAQMGKAGFWAVSNGTELEAYEDLLGPAGIASIQITFDGPPDEHDRRRIHADGSGSWQKIAANIHRALGRGVGIAARVNLDRHNVADLPRLAEAIAAEGWDKHPKFTAYAAVVRAENDRTDKKTTFDSWELDLAMDDIRELFPLTRMIDRPDDKIKSTARRVFREEGAAQASLRESFCSAHGRMYIFDAFADIYACWERTGDAKVRLGRIDEEGRLALNATAEHLWRSRTVASNPVCSSCRYALHCGGGCAVLAEARTGKMNMNFCDGFANRFRMAVAEAFVDHTRGAEMSKVSELVCDQ
jgi:uncharacterized protein